MNIVLFNQEFIEAIHDFHRDVPKYDGNFNVKALQSAPLFVHHDSKEDWRKADYPDYFDQNGLPLLPFPAIRANLTTVDGSGALETQCDVFVSEFIGKDGERSLDCMTRMNHQKVADLKLFNEMAEKHKGDAVSRDIAYLRAGGGRRNSPGGLMVLFKFPINGKQSPYWTWHRGEGILDLGGRDTFLTDADVTWIEVSCEVINKLIIDINSPYLHKAICRPNRQGKSVEWVQSRTHYVLLHKNHPANIKGHTGKVSVNAGNEIKRIAHSRRSHFRLLKSPKFINKVGQRIPVRSTWIGSREFISGDSIYTVV